MDIRKIIPLGTTDTQSLRVVDELTVGFSVPGMPMVFATPQMIHHMEVVSAACIAPLLPPGYVSVGTRVDVEHLAATPVGVDVETTARVVDVDGLKVTFEVAARDDLQTIGRGTHTRAVVALERFNAGLAHRKAGRE